MTTCKARGVSLCLQAERFFDAETREVDELGFHNPASSVCALTTTRLIIAQQSRLLLDQEVV